MTSSAFRGASEGVTDGGARQRAWKPLGDDWPCQIAPGTDETSYLRGWMRPRCPGSGTLCGTTEATSVQPITACAACDRREPPVCQKPWNRRPETQRASTLAYGDPYGVA